MDHNRLQTYNIYLDHIFIIFVKAVLKMETENQIKASVAILLAFSLKRQVKRKRWIKKWLQDQDKFTHLNLLNAIRNGRLSKFFPPFLSKKHTIMRSAISG
ncbi:unnamed protein product [Acanthoscelides obtectus]|uniref:Uncharacterized protein n=1 Tax=Acanthoscelides obtectus TaxID=200917 RepID=A0A9P0KT61_ACAOB|nr:unnamed protein product [Acanthoscelides obtectus]CAK1621037.1 hypothetical protein AOBTE_LOCUS714 [Acanthoscelides obtectus]